MINPLKSVEVNTYYLHHPKVLPSLVDFSIAQISDIHLGRWVKPRHIRQVVSYINQRKPDIVALTGDYVGYSKSDIFPCIQTLSFLKPPTYAVLGNHDHWTSTEQCRNAFKEMNIPLLNNSSLRIHSRGGEPIDIVGVDDHVTGHADVDAAFKKITDDNFCLALNHVPAIAPDVASRGAHLILSGHTHGFQFNIPRLTNRIAQQFGTEFYAGAYRIENSYLYINRGLGSASWPWRIRANPELTFFILKSGDTPHLELKETTTIEIAHNLNE